MPSRGSIRIDGGARALLIVLAGAIAIIALSFSLTDEASAQGLPWWDYFDDGDASDWASLIGYDGYFEVTTSQYVSPEYSLRVVTPAARDRCVMMPYIEYDAGRDYVVELQFRYTGSSNHVELWKDYEMCVMLVGNKVYVRERISGDRQVGSMASDTWHHVKVIYHPSSDSNTLWIDGVQQATFAPENDISYVWLGDSDMGAGYGQAWYDDIKVYYEDEGFNFRPHWLALPPFTAVEDVPEVIDLGPYVSDPDTPPSGLYISSTSPSVSSVAGLNVTFMFRYEMSQATVTLVLSDTVFQVAADLNFTITLMNDPPICSLPAELSATEDVPLTIDLGPYLADDDTPHEDLSFTVSGPYVTSTGLRITVTFPDGVLSYDLYFNVSDGLDLTEVHVRFTVSPVDDPPAIRSLPEFVAAEDRDSPLNLTPYLYDVDTPIGELRVRTSDPNCTAVGQVLHFVFPRGGVVVDASFTVADATSGVKGVVRVRVNEFNDPPVVRGMLPKLLTEDRPETVDLSPYIDDEDTPRDRLVLECTDAHLVPPIRGFNITLLFTSWEIEQTVGFTVFDGQARSDGSFDVQIEPVNDPPAIVGLGTHAPPVSIVIDEGDEILLDVRVSDEDSTVFKYAIESAWSGITVFQNGTVRVDAAPGDIGNFTATLTVDDLSGSPASVTVAIRVVNVNDPPTSLVLFLPQNRTTVEEGTSVSFSAEVADPDVALGQVLTVSWTSNVSGPLKSLTSDRELRFTTDRLAVGVHRIVVTVTDGEYAREAWIELTVKARYVEPPVGPEEPPVTLGTAGLAAIAIVVVLAVVGVVIVVVLGRRGRAEEATVDRASAIPDATASSGAAGTPPRAQAQGPGAIAMEGDLRTLGTSPYDMASRLEATRAAEARAAAALPAGPAFEPVAVPEPVTLEDEAARERTREVREVMRALTQLPQGLPTTLWGWDMNELARTIVDGERRTGPDGTQLIMVKGRWYNADRTNVGVFMREWKEPEAPAPPRPGPMTSEERQDRLEQLEDALLEGKISEQTYRELKSKYEHG